MDGRTHANRFQHEHPPPPPPPPSKLIVLRGGGGYKYIYFKDIHTDSIFRLESKQERQIVARYARLTPSCKAGACTGQNSSMKNNKGH